MTPDRCCVGRCKGKVELTYIRRPLCKKHWVRVCKMLDDGEQVKVAAMLDLSVSKIVEREETQ